MNIRINNEFIRRPGHWNCALILAACLFSQASLQADDALVREKIENLSSSEKEELLRKREQFERLPPKEQDRMRQLHDSIESHSDVEQLQSVVEQYSAWLKTLSTSQRIDLLSLSPDERLERIREIKRRSEIDRFGRFTTRKLSMNDVREIFTWLDDELISGDQERMLARLDSSERESLSKVDRRRRNLQMLKMVLEKDEDIPTSVQIDKLVDKLSQEAQREFRAQETDSDKRKLARSWIHAATASRMRPPKISAEELERYFREDLRPEEREELERMPRDRMQFELSRMYFRDQMRRRIKGGPPHWGHDRGDRRMRGGPNRDGGPGRDRKDRRGSHRPPPPRPDGEKPLPPPLPPPSAPAEPSNADETRSDTTAP